MMQNEIKQGLQQEWVTLQNSYDQSERLTLLIKLGAVVVCLCGVLFEAAPFAIIVLILVLWLQDAIWKTFQARTGERLLILEKAMNGNEELSGVGFHTDWNEARPSSKALLVEYLSNAVRPTIAYPYVVLVGVLYSTLTH